MTVSIQKLDVKGFENIKEEWERLLAETAVDPLFLSWDWQHTWWQTWGERLDGELLLLTARLESGELVGIAPLYVSTEKLKKIININRVQFIGNNWRGVGTVRTEYLDFIVKPDFHADVVSAFVKYVHSQVRHSEFVICDLDDESPTAQLLTKESCALGYWRRVLDTDSSKLIRLRGNFQEYLSGLGKNTRLKFFNRRTLLESQGEVKVSYADEANLAEYFDVMNGLYKMRWGRPLFSGCNYRFHFDFCKKMYEQGKLRFSVLSVDGKPVSVLYNVRVDGTEYYIQSGFNHRFHKKISMGFLHLGYAVEDAFESGLKKFDLLIGRGKNTQYKTHVANHEKPVCALQLIKSRKMLVLYRIYDLCTLVWRRYC